MAFDFPAFKNAYEAKDANQWIAFFADNAEWIEYRQQDPPSKPNVMVGKARIGAFLLKVASAPITLAIEDEIITPERIAFRAWVEMPEGRRIVEHVFLYVPDGLIKRQVDVEAWD